MCTRTAFSSGTLGSIRIPRVSILLACTACCCPAFTSAAIDNLRTKPTSTVTRWNRRRSFLLPPLAFSNGCHSRFNSRLLGKVNHEKNMDKSGGVAFYAAAAAAETADHPQHPANDNNHGNDRDSLSIMQSSSNPQQQHPVPAAKKPKTHQKNRQNKRNSYKNQNNKTGTLHGNSYLKLALDPNTLDVLHRVATTVQEQEQQLINPNIHDAEEEEKKRGKCKLSRYYRCMTRDYLHVTLFFAGQALYSELSRKQLVYWHDQVKQLVANTTHNTMNLSAENHDSAKEKKRQTHPTQKATSTSLPTDHTLSLKFKGLDLFPPHRRDILVATFDAPPLLHQLHSSIQTLSSSKDAPLHGCLKQVTGKNKKGQVWLPHITLARLDGRVWKRQYQNHQSGSGGGKETTSWEETKERILQTAQEALQTILQEQDDKNYVQCLDTHVFGVTMGGIVPKLQDMAEKNNKNEKVGENASTGIEFDLVEPVQELLEEEEKELDWEFSFGSSSL